MPIRPSSLQLAELCTESAYLAAEHPEDNEYARKGRAVHDAIHAVWSGNGNASPVQDGDSEEARMVDRALNVLHRLKADGYTIRTEATVELVDDDGAILTAGTADVIAAKDDDYIVLDWKTGRSENVEDVNTNLQLACYALASHADRWGLVFLAEGENIVWSEPIGPSARAKWMDRIRAIQKAQRAAQPGDHCSRCYSRHLCGSYRGLVSTALSLLPGEPTGITLTDETASALAARAKLIEKALEMANDLVDQHAKAGGRVVVDGKELAFVEKAGRETVDVSALKRDGLTQYLKPGKPYPSRVWRKAG